MIRLHRTVDVQEGKLFEAVSLAKETAAYFNENYNTKVETLINIGGKVNQIIMSNEKAPGEGEHKIINYIRYYGNKEETFEQQQLRRNENKQEKDGRK